MKYIRLLVSGGALLGGCGIVLISLVTTAQARSTGETVSSKRMYVGQEILPDHLLYPLLMARDRVVLESATKEKKVALQLIYAQRRFEHAQKLLEKKKYGLALTTLTKAQKYLFQAAHIAQEESLSPETRQRIQNELIAKTTLLKTLQAYYPGEGNQVLSALILESEALLSTF